MHTGPEVCRGIVVVAGAKSLVVVGGGGGGGGAGVDGGDGSVVVMGSSVAIQDAQDDVGTHSGDRSATSCFSNSARRCKDYRSTYLQETEYRPVSQSKHRSYLVEY